MTLPGIISRGLALLILTCLPCVLLGAAAFGPRGAMITAALVLAGLLIAHFGSERFLLGKAGAMTNITPHLERSFELATADFEFERPKLMLVCAASLDMIVVRGALGPGTLVLSQGLLSNLDESELRAVLRLGVLQGREPGTPLRCTAATLAYLLLKVTPVAAVKLFLQKFPENPDSVAGPDKDMGSGAAILFWTLLPPLTFLLKTSQPVGIGSREVSSVPLQNALHKMAHSGLRSAVLDLPCFRPLSLTR